MNRCLRRGMNNLCKERRGKEGQVGQKSTQGVGMFQEHRAFVHLTLYTDRAVIDTRSGTKLPSVSPQNYSR
ncbi:no significant blast hit [Histoplasma capsulatum G186AR]|uniref:Uncharacterized protein n=1 Tax=Ajellomyces capsulatus TaxID=5037 RepID=A0A8H7YKI1_AJECA|nr:hypothetical protein I7I52_08363 [Histoplasma capsulatum]QSS68436.1 no significant blast hit [Histoplasma capsulatum G186AR]